MKQSNIYNSILVTILIVLAFYVSVSKNNNSNKIIKRLVEGKVNTLLLLLIIGLTLTEDLNIGFILCVIYLMALVKTQNTNEGFRSGPSPLNCSTYGNSREKTGTAFYPMHDNEDDVIAC